MPKNHQQFFWQGTPLAALLPKPQPAACGYVQESQLRKPRGNKPCPLNNPEAPGTWQLGKTCVKLFVGN